MKGAGGHGGRREYRSTRTDPAHNNSSTSSFSTIASSSRRSASVSGRRASSSSSSTLNQRLINQNNLNIVDINVSKLPADHVINVPHIAAGICKARNPNDQLGHDVTSTTSRRQHSMPIRSNDILSTCKDRLNLGGQRRFRAPASAPVSSPPSPSAPQDLPVTPRINHQYSIHGQFGTNPTKIDHGNSTNPSKIDQIYGGRRQDTNAASTYTSSCSRVNSPLSVSSSNSSSTISLSSSSNPESLRLHAMCLRAESAGDQCHGNCDCDAGSGNVNQSKGLNDRSTTRSQPIIHENSTRNTSGTGCITRGSSGSAMVVPAAAAGAPQISPCDSDPAMPSRRDSVNQHINHHGGSDEIAALTKRFITSVRGMSSRSGITTDASCSNRLRACLVGLHNEGNTCYLNACIQCLAHTLPLAAALVLFEEDRRSTIGLDDGMNRASSMAAAAACSYTAISGLATSSPHCKPDRTRERDQARRLALGFRELLRTLWSTNSPSTTPKHNPVSSASSFLHRLRDWDTQFSGYRQQDAQEAMRAILDGLHESLNQVSKPRYLDIYKEFESSCTKDELAQIAWDYHKSLNDSLIQDIFCGQLQSTIECCVCRRLSHCFDPFLDLSLPLPKERGCRLKGSSNKCQLDIQDCLALFVAPELLNGDNRYMCATCKPYQKRFSGSGPFTYKKDDTPVSYPLKGLDLAEFIENPQREHKHGVVYDLYAVCNHSGSIGSGHYTSQCKNIDGLWYSFNDTSVTPILDESRVVSSSAYILFYQLRP